LKSASARLRQVKQRQLNVEQQIAIEQERAKAVIQLTLKNGDTIAATELARGVINAVRTTDMTVSASSHEFHAGIERRISLSVGINPLDLGAKIEDTISLGYRFSDSQTSSTSTVWDPDQEELAKLNSAQALQQALIEADIIGANSEATIRTMALQLAELAIEEEIAYEEINRLAAEHNDLVNQYHHFLNLRAQAQ